MQWYRQRMASLSDVRVKRKIFCQLCIISMMSGHCANPIFFNKKNKTWRSRTLANPPPPTSDNISFLPHFLRIFACHTCHNCPFMWNIYIEGVGLVFDVGMQGINLHVKARKGTNTLRTCYVFDLHKYLIS